MRREGLFALIAVGIAVAASPLRAQQEIWPEPLEVVEVVKYQLFLTPTDSEPALVSQAQRIEQVLFSDLEFSGWFDIERMKPEPAGLPENSTAVEVFGKVFSEDGKSYFEGWVRDISSGDFLGGKKYELAQNSDRGIAHHFADEVVRLVTGELGVASTEIVFTRRRGDQWELVVCDYDGYNPRVLVRQSVPLLNPRWVDNNRAVIYTTYRDGKPDIYIRYLAGKSSQAIAAYQGQNAVADWSNRQRKLVAALSKDGNSEIYLLEKSGNIGRRLTHNRAIDTSPAWSPNGREVVFTSDRSGSPQLYLMERDGANVRRLTYSGGYNASPAWSPRGDRIAFVCRIDGKFQIAMITPEGEDGRLLTTDWKSHEDPRWAPNGRHIVYTEIGAGDQVISVVDTVTRGKRILAQGANPDWSSP